MLHGRRVPGRRSAMIAFMPVKEFLEIEDEDVKKYLWRSQSIKGEDNVRKLENDEKIAYWRENVSVKINNQSKFYKNSKLSEWIVYNKKAKKVSLSPINSRIFTMFIEDNFRYPEVVMALVKKATPTFCKKVIEGKIKTVRDILLYHASYTIRKKDVDIKVMLSYTYQDGLDLFHIFEDPENVKNLRLARSRIPRELAFTKAFKVKSDELETSDLEGRYDEWVKQQSEKYAALKGQRDENDGDNDIEIV